jgi:hypothetical protein
VFSGLNVFNNLWVDNVHQAVISGTSDIGGLTNVIYQNNVSAIYDTSGTDRPVELLLVESAGYDIATFIAANTWDNNFFSYDPTVDCDDGATCHETAYGCQTASWGSATQTDCDAWYDAGNDTIVNPQLETQTADYYNSFNNLAALLATNIITDVEYKSISTLLNQADFTGLTGVGGYNTALDPDTNVEALDTTAQTTMTANEPGAFGYEASPPIETGTGLYNILGGH